MICSPKIQELPHSPMNSHAWQDNTRSLGEMLNPENVPWRRLQNARVSVFNCFCSSRGSIVARLSDDISFQNTTHACS